MSHHFLSHRLIRKQFIVVGEKSKDVCWFTIIKIANITTRSRGINAFPILFLIPNRISRVPAISATFHKGLARTHARHCECMRRTPGVLKRSWWTVDKRNLVFARRVHGWNWARNSVRRVPRFLAKGVVRDQRRGVWMMREEGDKKAGKIIEGRNAGIRKGRNRSRIKRRCKKKI